LSIAFSIEPFGLVALEAIQAGLTLIISRQSGVSETLENAIHVDYWNIQSMAEVIVRLLDESNLRNKFRKDGMKEVEKRV